MGKQPTTGQKKSKDQIAKAATQKKGGAHKKWTKGKVKEKAQHAVFVDQATYDRMAQGIPKLGNHISVSSIIEKFKVIGSIARMMIRDLVKNGSLKVVDPHGKQVICTPCAVPVAQTKVVATEVQKETKKEKVKKEKK